MKLGLGILGLRQARVRARATLTVLRWHVVTQRRLTKTNLGYSQDQGYS